MEIWQGLLLGIVQGATEFLPVSSSGHLFLTEHWLGLSPDLHFIVSAHVASLLAVILVYYKDLWQLLRGAVLWVFDRSHRHAGPGRLAWQLVLATFCTVCVALVIEPYFENLLTLPWVAGTLIVTGILIVLAETIRPKEERAFTWQLAIVLGFIQGLAVVPGISRSGLTIALLIMLGLNRRAAVRISFLLSIPTILGALVFATKDQWAAIDFDMAAWVGCMASFITALLSIYGMKQLVERHWLWFAPYCILLGGSILTWLYFLS